MGTRKPFRGRVGREAVIPAAFFLFLFRDPSLSPSPKGGPPQPLAKGEWPRTIGK